MCVVEAWLRYFVLTTGLFNGEWWEGRIFLMFLVAVVTKVNYDGKCGGGGGYY